MKCAAGWKRSCALSSLGLFGQEYGERAVSLSVSRLLPFEKVHFPLLHAKVLGANVGLYPMLGLNRRDLFVAIIKKTVEAWQKIPMPDR